MRVGQLRSGGLMVTCACPSRCRHCLYRCGPQRDKAYLNAEEAARLCRRIRALGCDRVHIGGGEPFVDVPRLLQVLDAARQEQVAVEYVETNAAWFRDAASAAEVMAQLRERGVETLLVSISPMHNEFVPWRRTRGLLQACRAEGMGVFPWVPGFIPDIESFADDVPHALEEYTARFGERYLAQIQARYWLHPGGRALATFAPLSEPVPTAELADLPPCRELADTSHFHFDLYGNYVPGLCSGLAIAASDVGSALDAEQYPLITRLFSRGIGALLQLAETEHGFVPQPAYPSKCHLCDDIRRHLASRQVWRELQPAEFYTVA